MSFIVEAGLMIAVAGNIVSIWLLASSNERLNRRVEYLEVLVRTMEVNKKIFIHKSTFENSIAS